MNNNEIKGSGPARVSIKTLVAARYYSFLILAFAFLLPGCSWLQWPSSADQFFEEGFVRSQPKYYPIPDGKGGDRAVTITPPGTLYKSVGSEVILVGGVIGDDNHYKTGRTIEWTLSQESVGQFIDVGRKDCIDWFSLNFTNPRRVDNDYAITSTITNYHVLNRGTPTTVDDVRVQAGQTWVSVMSTSPGVSRVTAKGPSVQCWHGRTATTTIVWIDAEWQFPSVAIVSPGNSHPLVTRITRQNGCSPPAGNWMVQYTVDEACPAVFTPEGTKSVTVGLDESGAATAVLAPIEGASCATVPVSVAIIPPPEVANTQCLDRGSTTVTWATTPSPEISTPPTFSGGTGVPTVATPSVGGMDPTLPSGGTSTPPTSPPVTGPPLTGSQLPNVMLQVVGPPQVEVGQEFQVNVTVTNHGDRTTPPLTLVETYGEGLEHPKTSENPISVEIQPLNPNDERPIIIRFRATEPGEHEHTVRIEVNGQEIATRTSSVRAVLPGTGSSIGDWQGNEGAAPDVPGMTGDGTTAPPPLPGDATDPAMIPAGSVKLTVVGPPTVRDNEEVQFKIEVANHSLVTLKGLQVFERHDTRQLKVVSISEGYAQADNGSDYYWVIPELAPQKIQVLKVKFKPLVAESQIPVRTEAFLQSVAIAEARTTINVQSDVAAPPVPPTPPAINPAIDSGAGPPLIGPAEMTPDTGVGSGLPMTDELTLEIADRNDNIPVGDNVYYEIYIRNNSNRPDTQVQLSVFLPEGMILDRMKTGGSTSLKNYENQIVTFEPVAQLPGGKELIYRVVATYNRVGNVVVKAEVRSASLPQPILDDQRTEFYQAQ